MKINALPTQRNRQMSGFTLIEMIGVLAVIAILAAVLIPKVFEAINNARVSNAAMTVNSVKTACVDHYAKFGAFPVDGTVNPPTQMTTPIAQYDLQLVKEGLMDKPFVVKIGDGVYGSTNSRVQLISCQTAATAPTGANGAYNLSGTATGANANEAAGTWIIEAVITGVQEVDAQQLNKAIDGPTPSLGAATGAADLGGRVEYAAAPTSGPTAGLVNVHVYLTHR